MRAEKLKTEVRQEQIAEAALRQVAAEGIRGLSVAKIAEHVGVVPSALYRHYRSKSKLLDAMLERIRAKLMANVEDILCETHDPLEQLEKLAMRHIRLVRENEAIPRIIFSEDICGPNSDRGRRAYRIIREYLGRVAAIVAEGQAGGSIRNDLRPESAALLWLGLIQPGAILWHLSGGRFDLAGHARENWRIVRAALQPPPSRAKPRVNQGD